MGKKQMNKEETYAYLDAKGIEYEIINHKAVFNMAELSGTEIPYPEGDAKNLFLRDDKKQAYYLLTVKGDKRIDLKAFRKANGTRQLTFAGADELLELMKLAPGAVTPLGLLNDDGRKVRLYLDRDLCGGMIGCHPNDNTATIWPRSSDLIALIEEHGNAVHIVSM